MEEVQISADKPEGALNRVKDVAKRLLKAEAWVHIRNAADGVFDHVQ